jgi:hypothetical protein
LKSSALNCRSSAFPVGAFTKKGARKSIGRVKVLDRELAPLMLVHPANEGAPNRDQFALVQYPHNTQKPSNSGNRHQNGEYRYLSPVEVIVLRQSCLAMV